MDCWKNKRAMWNKYAIVVAGGAGTRMGAALPKQFLLLAGKPIAMHSLQQFYSYDTRITLILVLPKEHLATWEHLCAEYGFMLPHSVVVGGATRFESVKNALQLVPKQALVAVHDSVRPLVSQEVISCCFEQAAIQAAVIPVLPVVDSLRILTETGSVPVDRQNYRVVQTPQVFQSDVLLQAYQQAYRDSFTDDASVVEGIAKVHLVEGNSENIKITGPADLLVAEALWQTSTEAESS